jgi:hypothetical protein
MGFKSFAMRSGLILALSAPIIPPSSAFARKPDPASIAQAPARSFEYVRSRLDRAIPDMVASKIAESGDIGKIVAINRRARKLQKNAVLLRALGNESFASFFVRDPLKATWAINSIGFYTGSRTKDPKRREEDVDLALSVLGGPKLAPIFSKYPETFVNIAMEAGSDTWQAFSQLEGKRVEGVVASAISRFDDTAIELGRPLDDLRGNEAERKEYLSKLGLPQALGLLCSDPSFFQRSSNQLLFDRLKKDFSGNLPGLRERYGLDQSQIRNLAFRALGNGRIDDFITEKSRDNDAWSAGEAVLGSVAEKTGVYAERFDGRHFYLLANHSKDVLRRFPWALGIVDGRMKRLQKPRDGDERKIAHALAFLRYLFTDDPRGDGELIRLGSGKAVYDPAGYRVAGKINAVQVFDRRDTRNSHWKLSQDWFRRRFGNPRVAASGELVFEGRNARVTLYMGNSPADNAQYIADWVRNNEAGIITFRGHSNSLMNNMPLNLFGNRTGRYVFILGSCGSSGSVPGYMDANPDTDLQPISYPSTGRGQVTNTLLEILLDQKEPVGFSKIIEGNSRRIEAHQGDPRMISVWTLGEGLLNYVARKTQG